MTMDLAKVEMEARRDSTRIAQKIADMGNNHSMKKGYAALVSSMAMQTVMLTILVDEFEPGSTEGRKAIEGFWNESLKDALKRWDAPDMKYARPGQERPKNLDKCIQLGGHDIRDKQSDYTPDQLGYREAQCHRCGIWTARPGIKPEG